MTTTKKKTLSPAPFQTLQGGLQTCLLRHLEEDLLVLAVFAFQATRSDISQPCLKKKPKRCGTENIVGLLISVA